MGHAGAAEAASMCGATGLASAYGRFLVDRLDRAEGGIYVAGRGARPPARFTEVVRDARQRLYIAQWYAAAGDVESAALICESATLRDDCLLRSDALSGRALTSVGRARLIRDSAAAWRVAATNALESTNDPEARLAALVDAHLTGAQRGVTALVAR